MAITKRQAVQICKEICETVGNDIQYVNSGGCVVFAVNLCERLHAAGFTDAKIRVYSNPIGGSYADVSQAASNVNTVDDHAEWRRNGVDFTHVRVEFAGRLWDAGNSVQRWCAKYYDPHKIWGKMYKLLDGELPVKQARILANNPKGWNFWFPRSEIPKMENIMDLMFMSA